MRIVWIAMEHIRHKGGCMQEYKGVILSPRFESALLEADLNYLPYSRDGRSYDNIPLFDNEGLTWMLWQAEFLKRLRGYEICRQ